MKRPTKSLLVAPLAIALIALAGCGKSDSGSGGAAGAAVTGKAAPAGKIWAEQVVATPEGGFRMGNPEAPIKLIEFGSYTCSHCRDFSAESHDPLERDYVNTGKVSFEYRNFIRDPVDMAIALIARCGGAEPFFPLSKQLFEHQEDLFKKIQSLGQPALDAALASPPDQRFVMVAQLTGLIEFAMQRGLPEAKARQCLADSKAVEALAEGVRKSTSEFNIEGTPTLILNGSKLDNVASWPLLVERLKAAGA